MKNSADVEECYLPRPKVEVNNTLREFRHYAVCFSAQQNNRTPGFSVNGSITWSGLYFLHLFYVFFQYDEVLSKFGEQQLVMLNYVCGLSQSKTGKYFEWVINNFSPLATDTEVNSCFSIYQNSEVMYTTKHWFNLIYIFQQRNTCTVCRVKRTEEEGQVSCRVQQINYVISKGIREAVGTMHPIEEKSRKILAF